MKREPDLDKSVSELSQNRIVMADTFRGRGGFSTTFFPLSLVFPPVSPHAEAPAFTYSIRASTL